ncbi:MAG: Gfo/Idh/MocA family oxidoreductase [Oceanospirillaceae bacterium]|nr:Gfo/Idh/MocA family oxidoreductase [Oceanospirillaceae bacterium]
MRIAIVGVGSRHKMYRDSIVEDYADQHQIVALCDINEHRLMLSAKEIPLVNEQQVATYKVTEFDQLLAEQKPELIIVTTPDFLHDVYIKKAFDAGCNVICEKPMTINLEKLKIILDAQKRSDQAVTVTFNYRYSPARTQIKELIMNDTIGDITAVDFRWHLDRVHGADYFRRWHRQHKFSGGLLVHKSTHHFDLLNWWMDSTPTQVFATGSRAFYRPETADAMGLQGRGERCSECKLSNKCDMTLNMRDQPELKSLYQDAEYADGYMRDQCVFAEEIGIEDTMQAHIRYASGASANYTLVAYSPWEGLEVVFQGTKGEIRHRHIEVHGVFGGKREHAVDNTVTTLQLAGEAVQELDVWSGEGNHGGADPVMLDILFNEKGDKQDKYSRAANHVMGGWSILTGIAANQSIASGNMVDIDQMLQRNGIDLPRPVSIMETQTL